MKQQEIKIRQIICYTYVIGIIGMMGMGRVLGDEGLACLAVAMEGISLFALLMTCGVSDVIARLQRNRRSKEQFKGAARMWGQLLLSQGIMGALLSAVLLLLADPLAGKLFRVPGSAAAMRLLAPMILLQALDAALLGYFQGGGSYMPTLVSAVLRQGFFLVFGSLFGRLLADYGSKVSRLLKNSSYSGMYGAMGVAIGILAAEILVLLFLLVIYLGSGRNADEQRGQEGLRHTESMTDVLKTFYRALWQGICTALLVLLPAVMSTISYLRKAPGLYIAVSTQASSDVPGGDTISLARLAAGEAAASFGSFFGRCILLCAAFILILTARCFSVYGRLQGAIRREDARHTRDVAASGLHYVWTVGLYFAVTMLMMAPQIAAGFLPGGEEEVTGMLRAGGVLVLLAGLAVLFSMILLAHGERHILMGMLGVWMLLVLLFQNAFVRGSNYGASGILSGVLVATGILLAGLAAYCIRQGRIGTEYVRVLGIPLAAAGITALAMLLIMKIFGAHMGHVAAVAVAALLGAVVYGTILVAAKNIREYEISILYGKKARKLLERIIS